MRGYVWRTPSPFPPLTLFSLELFDRFFLFCRKSASYLRKIIENRKLAVQIEIFPKNTFFTIPPPTLWCVAQTTYAQKIRSRHRSCKPGYDRSIRDCVHASPCCVKSRWVSVVARCNTIVREPNGIILSNVSGLKGTFAMVNARRDAVSWTRLG